MVGKMNRYDKKPDDRKFSGLKQVVQKVFWWGYFGGIIASYELLEVQDIFFDGALGNLFWFLFFFHIIWLGIWMDLRLDKRITFEDFALMIGCLAIFNVLTAVVLWIGG